METTGSDNVGDDDAVYQDGPLRFVEKGNEDKAGDKTINCKQPTEK